jgi:cytochrome c oxidase subunit 1
MLLRLGIVRALVGSVIGAVIGTILMMGIQIIAGVETAWNNPMVLAIASVTFILGFMVGIGGFTDWAKWAFGIETGDGHYHPQADIPEWERYFSFDVNHKIIGIQYTVTSFLLLMTGGLFALIFRTELMDPGMQIIDMPTYNTLIGLHGWVMIGAILLGIGGMANYLVPLQIGAQDMAFPRWNAFAFWLNIPATILLSLSLFFGGFDTGWTAYAPLSVHAALGMQFVLIGVFIIGLSSILGGLNLIVTILGMRAPGMTMFRMPIFVWGVLATALISLTATQYIGLAFLMVILERLTGMPFFNPAKGGDPILYQHIFWFYSHPAVYVFVLPGLGVISELLPVFVRKPLFGYKWVALSSMAIAVVGFLVWAHHMYTSGMNIGLRIPFMIMTLFVAVPTGVKFFSWLATLWGGKISFQAPMLFVIGAFIVFLLGGLTGPPNALVVTDLQLHDTYWVVAHFHYTMFGGFVFAFMAATYFWYPKVTGRMYNEWLARIHFIFMVGGFLTLTTAMFRLGLMGMRRRIGDYLPDSGYGDWHLIATLGGFLVATAVLLWLVNLLVSLRIGAVAGNNPWNSRGLEWQISSPPPEYNYETVPRIVGEPYDYGLADSHYATIDIPVSAVPAVGD